MADAELGVGADVSPLLAVTNLEVLYGGVSLALRGVSFEVPPHGVVALLGANGAGKTSTIRAVSGLLPLHGGAIMDGEVLLAGRSIKGLAPPAIVALGVGQVPEGRLIFGQLTVDENLRVGASACGHRGLGDSLARVYDLFPALKDRRRQKAGWLSGGEQQMVAIGRALMAEPRLLLLDEVSLGLAPRVVEAIFVKLYEVRQELGTAMLLVEQNARIALEFAEYGYVLEGGRIVVEAPTTALRRNADVQETYLGGGGSERHRRSYADAKRLRRRRRRSLL